LIKIPRYIILALGERIRSPAQFARGWGMPGKRETKTRGGHGAKRAARCKILPRFGWWPAWVFLLSRFKLSSRSGPRGTGKVNDGCSRGGGAVPYNGHI